MNDFGFIITRNIKTPTHEKYWRECVRSIRLYYDTPILIIDDNSSIMSDYEKEQSEFSNIQIIQSEIPGAGEILGYYYAQKLRLFKTFVVLHDSMFLTRPLEMDGITTARFLWHFEKYLGQSIEQKPTAVSDRNIYYIEMLPPPVTKSIESLYFNKRAWVGCFGVASIMTLDFANTLFCKYNLEHIIRNVKIRSDREAMERILALICIDTDPTILDNPSINGSILSEYPYWGLSWEKYLHQQNNFRRTLKMVKVFSGR